MGGPTEGVKDVIVMALQARVAKLARDYAVTERRMWQWVAVVADEQVAAVKPYGEGDDE